MSKNIVFGLYKYVRENVSEENIEKAATYKQEIPIIEDKPVEVKEEVKKVEVIEEPQKTEEGKVPADPSHVTPKTQQELKEDDNKEIVLGEFSDEAVAKEMANEKKGEVVQDPETKKWKVIVKEAKKAKADSKSIPGVEKSLKGGLDVEEPKKIKEDVEINVKTDEKEVNIVDVPGGTQTTVIEKPAESAVELAPNTATEEKPVSAVEPKSTEMGLIEEPPKEEVKEEPIESKVKEAKVNEDKEEFDKLCTDYYEGKIVFEAFIAEINKLDIGKENESKITEQKKDKKEDKKEEEADPNRPAYNLLKRIHKAQDKATLEHLMDQLEKDTVSGKIVAEQETRLKGAIDRRKAALEANPEAPATEPTEKEEKEIEECIIKEATTPIKESSDDFTWGFAESIQRSLKEVLGAEVSLERTAAKLKTIDRIGLEALRKAVEIRDAEVLKQLLNAILENKETK